DSWAAARGAGARAGSTAEACQGRVVGAMRNGLGSRPTSLRNGAAGGGAQYGSPTSGPEVASSNAALSRTLHVTAWPTEAPLQPSPTSGPIGLRARVGLRPNNPQHEAGIRIEPPPSVAGALRGIPAATAPA